MYVCLNKREREKRGKTAFGNTRGKCRKIERERKGGEYIDILCILLVSIYSIFRGTYP